jgi:predicted lipoprotein
VTPASADTTPDQYRSVVENTIEQYLRPEFTALTEKTEAITIAMEALCAAPSAEGLAAANNSFNDVLAAWSFVEYARLGPVIEGKRLERFSFWPDPKGIGLRQVQEVLAKKEPTASDAATLKGKSVALQGLQALEFVLFGTGSEALAEGDEFRCSYGRAIGENLDAIAGEISAGWEDEAGYVALMRDPGPDNPVYRTPAEPTGDIIEILTTGFQYLRDVKIGAFIGENPKKAKPRRAAFWRSGQSLAAIRANFEGLKRLWEVSGLIAVLETRPGGPAMINSVNFEFDTALRDLDAGFPPLEQAVTQAKDHNRIIYLFIVADTLWKLFAEDISGALGLRMGFNALDGD